jgi:hypothetical protein
VRKELVAALAAALVALGGPGCATLETVGIAPRVDFFLDRVDRARLAGVDLDRVERAQDLGPLDMARIADAVRQRRLPFQFTLHVGVENEMASEVDLHLERLEWTLLLRDRETVTGTLDEGFVLRAREVTDIPIAMEVDLLRFFDDRGEDLVELALRAAGAGGEPMGLKLRARPTIRTSFGPFRYPQEITILDRAL